MAKIGINLTTGSLQKEEIIVGIDLGTTNSLIAIIHPDTRQPTVLKEIDHTALVPSLIHFGKNDQVVVGNEAKPFLISDPENTVFSVKRLMGKSYKDIQASATTFSYKIIDEEDRLVRLQVGSRFYDPTELSSLILKALKQRAEHILKTPVNRAVITVPAYFNDAQRQATRDAGKLAGLDVLRIVNEPTAASLAYGMGLKAGEDRTVAVYDLGGGTFDISILRISNGIFEVLSTNGDTYLGGDDFDRCIVNYWTENAALNESDKADRSLMQELRLAAEEAKRHLSQEESFETVIRNRNYSITKVIFQQLIHPLVEKTLDCCRQALSDARVGIDEIEEIILVGGSTRVPLVRESVSAFFKKPVNDSVNPDEVVALGAAVQADILAGNNKDILLLDITPLSLGIETMGGLMDVLIPRNSKIPSKAGRQYTTQKDGQSAMRIAVFQGERDLVADNRKLAEFSLSGIPGMPAGMPKVEVSFLINADGILVVKAKELRSGVEQSIEVKPQYGLTDAAVEQQLLDSLKHAKEDMQQRSLLEARNEGIVLLEMTHGFLKKNALGLSEKEKESTAIAISQLESVLPQEEKDAIQAAIEQLNETTKPFAERLMDEAIQAAMTGKKII